MLFYFPDIIIYIYLCWYTCSIITIILWVLSVYSFILAIYHCHSMLTIQLSHMIYTPGYSSHQWHRFILAEWHAGTKEVHAAWVGESGTVLQTIPIRHTLIRLQFSVVSNNINVKTITNHCSTLLTPVYNMQILMGPSSVSAWSDWPFLSAEKKVCFYQI